MINKIDEIYNYLKENKCKDISVYNSISDNNLNDIVVVISHSNIAKNKEFAEKFMKDVDLDIYPEGFYKGEWIVFDFNDIVIHSFVSSVREKYNLDKLYKTKKVTIEKQNKK